MRLTEKVSLNVRHILLVLIDVVQSTQKGVLRSRYGGGMTLFLTPNNNNTVIRFRFTAKMGLGNGCHFVRITKFA